MTEKAIEKAARVLKERREAGEVINVEFNLMIKAKNHPSSKVKAIAAMCFHCFGGTENEMPDPGWKKLVRSCTSKSCPLYPHRPYK